MIHSSTLNGQNPSALWPGLKRMSTTAGIPFPSPAWAARRNASPPKATGQCLLVPPCQQPGKEQYSKQCAMHFTCSPSTKPYHPEKRTPQRKRRYPDLPDSFHTRTRGHQIELAVLWFKTYFLSFFLPPSLKKVVLYTVNAHLLGDAGEATGLQGFNQRQERSSGENPTEVSQAAEPTSSAGSPKTKSAESLGDSKWHFSDDCLFYRPQLST